jgi:hypothetical protein
MRCSGQPIHQDIREIFNSFRTLDKMFCFLKHFCFGRFFFPQILLRLRTKLPNHPLHLEVLMSYLTEVGREEFRGSAVRGQEEQKGTSGEETPLQPGRAQKGRGWWRRGDAGSALFRSTTFSKISLGLCKSKKFA